MGTKDGTANHNTLPNELTPEEAREKRKYHLALARKQALAAQDQDDGECDSPDSLLTTFILPGD